MEGKRLRYTKNNNVMRSQQNGTKDTSPKGIEPTSFAFRAVVLPLY